MGLAEERGDHHARLGTGGGRTERSRRAIERGAYTESHRLDPLEPTSPRRASLDEQTIDYRSRDNLPAERNKQPIAGVLAGALPERGLALEIASGTGQHAEHFARAWPELAWQPSEPEPRARALLAARVAAVGLPNLRAPLHRADAVVCINMVHIAPWSACEALMRHAASLLSAGAPLVLYGPFMRDRTHTAPSNAAFDANLRARNPEWGVRDLGAVDALARDRGFELESTVAMPANNFTVVWRRVSRA